MAKRKSAYVPKFQRKWRATNLRKKKFVAYNEIPIEEDEEPWEDDNSDIEDYNTSGKDSYGNNSKELC